MYDPHVDFPSHAAEPPQQNNNRLILWGCVAGAGALVVLLLCIVAGVALYFLMPQQLGSAGSPPLIAAGQPGPPPVSPRADGPLTLTGPVRIDEDFEQPTRRWDQSSAQVTADAYELRVDTPNNDSYGLFLGGSGVRNFDMAVDIEQVGGDPEAEYGIRFRQSGPEDYLLFSISGTGYYRLVRVQDDDYRPLVPWTASPAVKTGPGAVNRLRMVADEERLLGSINGTTVVDVTDPEDGPGAAGQLTLGVTTFDQGDLAVRFDAIAGAAEGRDLTEDFSDPEQVPWSIGGAQIVGGAYELFAGGGIQFWQQPLPPGSSRVADFVLDVDATPLDMGADAAYGIIFGDSGSFDFYALYLDRAGNIEIVRSSQGLVLPPTPFAGIQTGPGATNRLHLEVTGDRMLIEINGDELALRSPEPIQAGRVGVIVSSGEAGRAQVQFDNFRLEEQVGGEEAMAR